MRRLSEVHHLRGEAQARAYLHPVRMRILDLLAQAPLTVSQVAARLAVHPANLTHHFRKLTSGGLIRLIEERDVGRVVEKYYRAIAHTFELRAGKVAKVLAKVAMKGAAQRALVTLAQDMREAGRQLPPDTRGVICLLAHARIPPHSFARFATKLQSLVKEFRKESHKQSHKQGRRSGAKHPNELSYSLNVSLYPRPHARSGAGPRAP